MVPLNGGSWITAMALIVIAAWIHVAHRLKIPDELIAIGALLMFPLEILLIYWLAA